MVKTYTVEAVGLRLRPGGEADRIVSLFTRERGKVAAVAKGVRKPHSKFGGRLDFFMRGRVTLHAGKSLDVVTGVVSLPSVWERLVDPDVFTAASYVAEVIDSLCEPEMAVPAIYDLLCEFQDSLAATTAVDRKPQLDVLLAAADLRMLSAFGLAPELDACARCGSPLGNRPLASGRAMLSPHAGGLLCSSCVKQLRGEGAEGDVRDMFSISAPALAALRALRHADFSKLPANGAASLQRATRSFVEYQMGRKSKALSASGSRS